MKNLRLLFILPAMVAAQTVFSQTSAHLTLSDQFPAAGEKISMTYDPSGTALDGQKDIKAIALYVSNRSLANAEIDLKPSGNKLTGDFTITDNAQLLYFRISSGSIIDDNAENGYVYLIYKDKHPVQGAYASDAYLITSGMGKQVAKIKLDNEKGLDLYKQEFSAYPQSKKDYDAAYYVLMARVPAYAETVKAKTTELEKSSNEDDLMLASTLLNVSKNKKGADSLNAIIRAKYPNGTLVKNGLVIAFRKETDLAKKDSMYNAFIKRYPENATDKFDIQDNLRLLLAEAYLDAGDMNNYHKYEALVKDKANLAGSLNNIAYEWAKKSEKLDVAAQLSKKSLDIMSDAAAKAATDQAKKNYGLDYDMYADTYAFILAKQNKFAEALTYEQPVVDHSKNIDPDVYANYIQILVANGMDAKAQAAAEAAIKAGQGTGEIKEAFKKLYIETHGNDTGFDVYVANLEKPEKQKALDDLAKTMINKPAPAFTLKDLDGNTVSLADLKGKVVLVDFWATWCGPCKASFPGMQMAVTKYKNDPNVKFLFVDCWETDANYVDGVKKFIADNKCTFHVLVDEKVASGRQEKVVSTFGVDGIPTKFIIDKDGNIRFTYMGYTGTPENLVDEVTEMIDMTKNAGATGSATASDNAKSGTNK